MWGYESWQCQPLHWKAQVANVAIFTVAVLQNLIRMTRVRAVRPRSKTGVSERKQEGTMEHGTGDGWVVLYTKLGPRSEWPQRKNKKDLSKGPNTTGKHQTQVAIFALTVSFFKGHFLIRQRLVEVGLLLIVSVFCGPSWPQKRDGWNFSLKCSHATKGFKGIIVFAFRSDSAPKPREVFASGRWMMLIVGL